MIIDKIEEARLRSARRRMLIIIATLATICVVGLVVFTLSLLDFTTGDTSLPLSVPKQNVSVDDEENVRTTFKENLLQYENELEPRLGAVGLEIWNRDGLFEITELKKEMMVFFSSGEYGKALESLQLLESRTATILEEAEHLYNENMEKAASFLEEDLYDEAKLHIDKALIIAPQSPEAMALYEKIEKLPVIFPLLAGAKVARTENDVQKEYNFLQQIVVVAPQREEEASRLRELAEVIKRQSFESHISSGFAAIEKAQIKEARGHYKEAQKVAPERVELSLLSAQISTLEKSLRVRRYIVQAEQAVAQDDWSQAKESYAKAAQDAPEDIAVVEGLQETEHMLGLLNRLNLQIENPYRLTNSSVLKDAEKVLTEANVLSGSSLTVKRQADQLRELITKINRLIPVTVISDNKTYIQVRGVGKVGMVSEKIIQLKPGKYNFEGIRDGFKAKLVPVFITYDLENYRVHIVCDEHI